MSVSARAHLAGRIHYAAIHLIRTLRSAGDETITQAQMSVLATLVNGGEMTLGELAEAERVSAPTITRLVQRLEQLGLVLRRSSDTDGRVTLVRHTSAGWTSLEAAASGRTRALAERMETFDDDEIVALERAAPLLERLAGR